MCPRGTCIMVLGQLLVHHVRQVRQGQCMLGAKASIVWGLEMKKGKDPRRMSEEAAWNVRANGVLRLIYKQMPSTAKARNMCPGKHPRIHHHTLCSTKTIVSLYKPRVSFLPGTKSPRWLPSPSLLLQSPRSAVPHLRLLLPSPSSRAMLLTSSLDPRTWPGARTTTRTTRRAATSTSRPLVTDTPLTSPVRETSLLARAGRLVPQGP